MGELFPWLRDRFIDRRERAGERELACRRAAGAAPPGLDGPFVRTVYTAYLDPSGASSAGSGERLVGTPQGNLRLCAARRAVPLPRRECVEAGGRVLAVAFVPLKDRRVP